MVITAVLLNIFYPILTKAKKKLNDYDLPIMVYNLGNVFENTKN